MTIKQIAVLLQKASPIYEYKAPHGNYVRRFLWQVEVPWGSELVRETVEAVDEKKALNKVLMGLAKKLNLQPRIVFSKVQAAKKFNVQQLR